MLRKRGAPTFIELLRNRGPRPGEGDQAAAPVPTGPRPSGFGPSPVGVAGRPKSDDQVSPMLFVRGSAPSGANANAGVGGTAAASGAASGRSGTATAAPAGDRPRGPLTITIEPKAPSRAAGAAAGGEGHGGGTVETGGTAGETVRQGLNTQRLFIWLAAATVLIVVVWGIAYSLGQSASERQKKEDLRRQHQAELDAAAAKAAELGGATAAAGAGDPAKTPGGVNGAGSGERKPAPPKPPVAEPSRKPENKPSSGSGALAASNIAIERLEKGYNYLVVATLMRKDADEAAKYLTDQGVPIAVVPSSDIDPADPRTNNPSFQWWVMVLRGYPGAELGKSQTERTAIDEKVKKLGRAWKVENKRAPTDFGQTFWKKYAGS